MQTFNVAGAAIMPTTNRLSSLSGFSAVITRVFKETLFYDGEVSGFNYLRYLAVYPEHDIDVRPAGTI